MINNANDMNQQQQKNERKKNANTTVRKNRMRNHILVAFLSLHKSFTIPILNLLTILMGSSCLIIDSVSANLFNLHLIQLPKSFFLFDQPIDTVHHYVNCEINSVLTLVFSFAFFQLS